MLREPNLKRALAFIDGQNLFHAAREAFGSRYPDYDVMRLSRAVCSAHDWELCGVRFYTGLPGRREAPFWHHYWSAKISVMRRLGVDVYTRRLAYRRKRALLPDGTPGEVTVGEEKGIDLRIGLDILEAVLLGHCDVVLLFSQDQDFSEVSRRLPIVAARDRRWLKMASAFPAGGTSRNRRGVHGTDWVPLDQTTWNACRDLRDYRPRRR
jgi:uncharacterized LabA/DUF88 family protein